MPPTAVMMRGDFVHHLAIERVFLLIAHCQTSRLQMASAHRSKGDGKRNLSYSSASLFLALDIGNIPEKPRFRECYD